MFVRRVFKQGNSVAIVIPTRFRDELAIEPGDLLAFDMTKDGGLRLRPLRVEDWTKAEKERKGER